MKHNYSSQWVRDQQKQFHDTIQGLRIESGCPDGVPLDWWCRHLAQVRKHAVACCEINDSGEQYKHPNADGAQALANLFGELTPQLKGTA